MLLNKIKNRVISKQEKQHVYEADQKKVARIENCLIPRKIKELNTFWEILLTFSNIPTPILRYGILIYVRHIL